MQDKNTELDELPFPIEGEPLTPQEIERNLSNWNAYLTVCNQYNAAAAAKKKAEQEAEDDAAASYYYEREYELRQAMYEEVYGEHDGWPFK